MYIQKKDLLYYLNLLSEDLVIYLEGLTNKEAPLALLSLFAFGYLLVPLTKINKGDSISGGLYIAYGLFCASLSFFIPPDILGEIDDLRQLLPAMTFFAIAPAYLWFKDYGQIIVKQKQEKKIDHELSHANDAFLEAMNETK